MKKILLLFSFLLFLQCGSIENYTTPDNKPALFNLNDIPAITLEFELKVWNKLLTNYDLNPSNEKKVVSRFTFDVNGTTIALDSIGLRLRGNTSRRRPEGNPGDLHNAADPNWHHVHFALDFSKNRADQRFKGLNKLNLKWFKDDPNYCREIYSYDLFARYGCWNAPRASYCKLTVKVKGDAKPAYYGVYAMIENIDEDFLTKNQDKWGSGIGFLWKGGWAGTNATFTTSSAQSIGVEDVNIDPSLSVYYAYDLKTRKDELPAAQAELTQFITDLNTKTGTAFQTWIAQKMDVPLFLKTYATHVMLGMWDDYWVNGNNFYFYFAPNGKAYFIPYDYDNTLGNFPNYRKCRHPRSAQMGQYDQKTTNHQNPRNPPVPSAVQKLCQRINKPQQRPLYRCQKHRTHSNLAKQNCQFSAQRHRRRHELRRQTRLLGQPTQLPTQNRQQPRWNRRPCQLFLEPSSEY